MLNDELDRSAGFAGAIIFLVALFCSLLFHSCYPPQKYDKDQNVSVTGWLREIAKVELGFVLVWEAHDGREQTEFISDTSGKHYIINVSTKDLLMKR